MTGDAKVLGSVDFAVEVDRPRVDAFAASAGLPADPVPMTFPACWLFEPPLRALVAGLLGNGVPVHVSQRFRYAQSIVVGGRYRVHVDVSEARIQNRPGLSVDLTAADDSGRVAVEAHSSIVVHDRAPEAASA